MNRKRLGYILIGGGIAMALLVGVLVYGQVQRAQEIQASLPKERVVVAAVDIPPRTEIAAAMINVRTVPDELVQVGSARNIEDVVGKFTPNGFTKGEVVNSNRIGPISAKNAPSFKIEKGKVMYAMPVTLVQGQPFSIAVVNALRPGDRVDLFYSLVNYPQGLTVEQRDEVRANPVPYLQTRVMLQDLRIQEIGRYAPDGSLISATGSTSAKPEGGQAAAAGDLLSAHILFIVSPEEALVLKWLKDAANFYKESNIEMVLRSPADEEKVDNNLLINFNYMREKYNLAPPPPNLTAPRR